jgi:hypothetical protein
MLCAAMAFASWWTSHTILDTARTRRVADVAFEDTTLRHFVATKVASVTAPAVAGPTATGGAIDQATLAARLEVVLDRPDLRAELEQFVVDAHDELIGTRSSPAMLDRSTVVTLVAAALPAASPADLAKLPPITFSAPQAGVLAASRTALANRFWLYLAGAVALVAIGLATTSDRRATLKLVGRWLLGISVVHLLVLWILPVVVIPHLTDDPWAALVAALARALSAGMVSGLVVLAAAGVALMVADRFVAPAPAPAPVPMEP